ncbi:MAG TPA: acyl-CoA dehydrogenase [Acidimicrobiia bacterium]|nr:acyl-CoA dehydrogenase [Acidimicrobiia bacterium]
MSHYRSNLEDLEFNLFEVLRVQDHLDRWSGLDRDTAHDILREVDRFAREVWAESFIEADRARIELVDGAVRLPDRLKAGLAAAHEAGWSRLGLTEELGGMEVPPTIFWATQELLLGANPTATFYGGGGMFARIIYDEGTESQRRLAKLMMERNWAGTMVLTEPDAGSDVGSGITKAVHIEGDTYHLEGVKRFITGGEHDAAENIIHLVLARPEGAAPGTKGLSLFIVPKFLVDANGDPGERNGVVATNLEKKMGLKGSTTCELTFGTDRPAVGYLVGGTHDGIRQMFRVIEHARMTIGTKSAATLSTGYLTALDYAKDRVQGADMTQMTDKTAPRVRIIQHPDVRRMLMRQKAYAEGLRALWMYAAWTQDMAVLEPEGGWERRSDLLLPLVKGYSSEKAYELLALSLQVLGGSGYTQDYPIEQYIRDAKIDSVYEGTTGIQAMDLFFRKIARDQGQVLASLAAEVADFVKGGGDDDPLAEERELLGRVLDDTQAHLGAMVEDLMACVAGESARIYEIGLHANALLESMAEVVIAWQLLRQAKIAQPRAAESQFHAGKVAAARFLVRDVAPQVAARRAAAEAEDGALMHLDESAF